jgi:hypothetical protein
MTDQEQKDQDLLIDALREKIHVQDLIVALEAHVLGQSKMTATQVSAALALLRKTLPDLLCVPVQKLMKIEALKTHEEVLEELD